MALDFSDRSTPLDEVIDTSRPSIENEDGSFSTESTITVERDGRYYLVPSIVGGKRLSDEEAALAWYDGKNPEVGGFRSAEEAGTAAKRRSETIGKKRGAGKLDFSKHGTLAEEQPAEEATLTTAMSRGIGQVFQGASAVGVDVNRRLLDTMDRVDRGERVPELDDTLGYQHMGAEDRAKARAQAQGSLVRGAKGVAQHGQAMETLPQAPAVERLTKAKTYGEAWDAFASDPVTVVGHLTAQSLPASAPGLALAVAGGGAAALANASRATRVGAGAAGMGTGSAAIEYASSIVQAMQEAGINVHDPAALEAASADPELMRTVREKATAKAGVVGAFDAVSGGIASKVLAPARMASRPVARQAVNIAAQAPVQGALGAAGEAAGSAAAGEEVSPGAVAAEFLGEFGGAPAEVATMAASAGRQPAIAPAIEQPAAPVAPAPPARDPGVIDFEAPDLAAMRAENLESSPGASAPPPAVGNEIEFTAPDPLEAAASIEGAEAAELARQVDAARAVDFEQPAAGERMELAPSEPAAPAGNEIDIKAFLRERALERAKDLTLAPERAAAELTFADQAVETAGNMRAAVTRAAALTESTGVQHRARTVGGQWAVVKIGRDVEAVSISSQESEVPDARAVEDAPATPAEPAIPAQPTEPATPATPQEASAAPVVEAAVTSAAAPDFSAQATPELDHAAHQAATSPENELPEPTEAQREAGNYRKGHPKIAGLDVSIENPAGSKRRPEWPDLKSHYGYVRRSEGADGDQVDAFIRPGTDADYAGPVFVVDQVKKDGSYDEAKVMIGFPDEASARAGYLENYTPGWKGLGAITPMTIDEFRAWVRDPARTRKPVGLKPAAKSVPINTDKTPLNPKPVTAGKALADVGEKIGGARKDRWRERGLAPEDLAEMSGGEQAQYATKDNVWPKIDYAKMIEGGVEPKVAAHLKLMRDRMAAAPRKDTEQGRRDYVEAVGLVRDLAAKVKTVEDVRALGTKLQAALRLPDQMGYSDRYKPENKARLEKLFTLYKGRRSPFEMPWRDERRVRELLESGWPKAKAREAVATGDGKAVPDRPYLDEVQRTGADVRGGRDITSKEFADTFGFRGVEFGNWAANDERQRIVNLAFEALHDLSDVLGIPLKAISLNGTLGLALAARGGGRFAAHYEPGKLVVNMTKIRGAGSLAHEWGHAFDHYFGELDQPNAYQGHARGASGWMGNRPDHTDDKRLPNLRPEMVKAFNGVLQALFKKTAGKAEMVRDAELQLERTEARLAQASEASRKDLLQRTAASQRQALEEMKRVMGAEERASTGARSSYHDQAIKLSGKSGESGYWARPTEMFARAFESYVFDKIRADDRVSDYLVHGVESKRYSVGYKGNPYPVGVEREAMNEAFDRLFKTMKTRETDKGVALFRRDAPKGPPLDAAALAKVVAPMAERLTVPVEVVESVEDLPAKMPADTAAMFFGGRIYLVRENIPDALTAQRRLVHEIVHAGKSARFRRDSAGFEKALRDLMDRNEQLRAQVSSWRVRWGPEEIDKAMDRGMTLADAERYMASLAREEGLAYYAEDLASLKGWKKFVAQVQAWLRSIGATRLADWLAGADDGAVAAFIKGLRVAVTKPAPEMAPDADLEPAFARRLFRGLRTAGDFVLPETPEYEGNITGDLARITPVAAKAHTRFEALPIRLPVGIVRDVHKGFGLQHLKAEMDAEPRRAPRKHTADLAENFARDVADLARTGDKLFYDQKSDRVILMGKSTYALVLETRESREGGGRYYSVVSMFKPTDVRKQWGSPVWVGRADLPTTEMPKSVAPEPSPGDAASAARPSTAGVQTEHFEFTPDEPPKAARTGFDPGALEFPGGGRGAPPAAAGAAGNRASWGAPEVGRADNVIRVLQDRHVDTKQVLKAIAQAGNEVADEADVYLREELYHKRSAKRTDDFINRELKPLVVDMASRGVTMAELERYLHARHAKEANAHVAERNPDLQDGGSGMTNAEAAQHLAEIPEAKRKALDVLAGKVDAIVRGTRDLLVTDKLEARGTVDGWAAQFKHYVPLMREDMGNGPGIGQGFSVKGPSSKERVGSKRAVVDILANIAMQRERAIVRAEKNRVSTALVALAQENPNPAFWKVDQPKKIRTVDPETNTVVDHTDPLYKQRPNAMVARTVNKDGEVVEHTVLFNERDERAMAMATALKNLDQDQLGMVMGAMGKATRFLASVNTQYNPVFGVKNFLRDLQAGLVNLQSTPLAGKQAAVMKHVFPALAGVYRDVRAERRVGEHARKGWAQTWEEFQNVGGTTGFRDMFIDSKARAKALEHEISRATEGKVMGSARDVFDWLSDYNTTLENAVRLAAYKVGVDSGMSKERAASLAKNLTVNFNRKGTITTQAGALYAFFNANVQGTARLAQTLASGSGGKIVAGGILLGAMQAALLAAAGFEEDEPADFERERSFIIPTFQGKGYIKIPMALGLHVLPNIGRAAAETAIHGTKNAGKRVADLLSTFLDAFNPVQGNTRLTLPSAAQLVSPTPFDPLVALANDEDWTGRPIKRREFKGDEAKPGHLKAKDTSTLFGRLVSKGLNYASGGTEHTAGKLSPTPDQVDYLVGQLTGGVGRELSKLEQTARAAVTGEKLPENKRFFVGGFYGDAGSPGSQRQRFYDGLREMNRHQSELEGRRKAGQPVADYLKDNPEARLYRAADEVEKRIGKMNKRRREMVAAGAKAEEVQRQEDRITKVMTEFNERVRSATKR